MNSNGKHITIVKPGAGTNTQSDAYDIAIQPGITGQQVVQQLGLGNDYVLAKADSQPLDMTADLYPLVDNGTKLYASTGATVGPRVR